MQLLGLDRNAHVPALVAAREAHVRILGEPAVERRLRRADRADRASSRARSPRSATRGSSRPRVDVVDEERVDVAAQDDGVARFALRESLERAARARPDSRSSRRPSRREDRRRFDRSARTASVGRTRSSAPCSRRASSRATAPARRRASCVGPHRARGTARRAAPARTRAASGIAARRASRRSTRSPKLRLVYERCCPATGMNPRGNGWCSYYA